MRVELEKNMFVFQMKNNEEKQEKNNGWMEIVFF